MSSFLRNWPLSRALNPLIPLNTLWHKPIQLRPTTRHHATVTPHGLPTKETSSPGGHAIDPTQMPQMELSSNSNELNKPLPLKQYPLHTRAARRFAVEGNVIVTGGAGFIGLEGCRAVLEHGANGLTIFDLIPSFRTHSKAIERLKSDFPHATISTQELDVTNEEAVNEAVARAAAEMGGVHMMHCYAGVVSTKRALDMTNADWNNVLNINATGSWYCARAAARHMIEQKTGGNIIFTASISAHTVNYPQPQVSYNVSKSAIIQLTKSLAAEWAKYGIRVNSISPGYMDTVLTMLNGGSGLEVGKEIWETRNPMGRMGTPEELTAAIILLASKAGGRYITGEDIRVDGGQTVF